MILPRRPSPLPIPVPDQDQEDVGQVVVPVEATEEEEPLQALVVVVAEKPVAGCRMPIKTQDSWGTRHSRPTSGHVESQPPLSWQEEPQPQS